MEVQFYNEIEFETIELESAHDVVTYSFIVQKSLTYLDLSACEYSQHRKSIFTEEQCRKNMEPRREILYSLNLDLPTNLEGSLRDIIPDADDEEQNEAFHLGVMYVCNFLYTRSFHNYVIDHIISARNQMEELKRYMNVMKLLKFNECRKTAMFMFDNLIFSLYPYCTDSNLVVDFAITFKFYCWVVHRESPILIGFVLHNAYLMRCNIFQQSKSGLDPINGCILFRTPGNISMLLVYGTVLYFNQDIYLDALGRPLESRLRRRISRKNMPERRVFLMLQFIYYFQFNNFHWEGLLYIWRSIPDPYLSESEMCCLFENVISSRKLYKMIESYKFFVVEDAKDNEDAPRPLQHLCRVVIRSALIRNHQLPYGIGQLGMPRLLRDYLNLKC